MVKNPVGWFEIYVNDIEKSKKFYSAVLQTEFSKLTEEPDFKMWAFPMDMDGGGAGGALVQMKGMKSGDNSVIVYFTSQDCSIEEARIVKNGGKIQKPKQSIGEYGFITLGADIDGNIFGLHSMK